MHYYVVVASAKRVRNGNSYNLFSSLEKGLDFIYEKASADGENCFGEFGQIWKQVKIGTYPAFESTGFDSLNNSEIDILTLIKCSCEEYHKIMEIGFSFNGKFYPSQRVVQRRINNNYYIDGQEEEKDPEESSNRPIIFGL